MNLLDYESSPHGDRPDRSVSDRYFADVRPSLHKRHGTHAQYGTRSGRSLAEHLDSACQFVLTVSAIADVPDEKRGLILAATAVHDLNKLDDRGRNVKTLARDRDFLTEQLERACVDTFVQTDADLELVRKLIERHSGHSASDGTRFLPEDPNIKRWAAMLIGADLFDLGIEPEKRIRKVETELTVALNRPVRLFHVRLSEDRGYLTALLLAACEQVLHDRGLQTLAIEPNGQIFLGETWPEEDLAPAIARLWQRKIDGVFGGNIEQLVRATKDGIKIDPKAIQQDPDAAIDVVDALLTKKFATYKADKVAGDVAKYGAAAGNEAIAQAKAAGLMAITTAEGFAISEGLKMLYLSDRAAGLSSSAVWDGIAEAVGLTPEQRQAIEPFNPQYGRCLFAASGVRGADTAIEAAMETIATALEASFERRQANDNADDNADGEDDTGGDRLGAVRQLLDFPDRPSNLSPARIHGFGHLNAYIEARPDHRCSLGSTTQSSAAIELISNNMPPGTKVQAFSNRLAGGKTSEPKRHGDELTALGYQLLAVGCSFPNRIAVKQDPVYLHIALPKGSSPELRRVWQTFLQRQFETNEGQPIAIDELKLIRDRVFEWRSNKTIGFALPTRPEFINSTVTLPSTWGDINRSLVLLKSLRQALELCLIDDVRFPFVLSGTLEIEPQWDSFATVEGIPTSLQPLLGSGRYSSAGQLGGVNRADRDRVLTVEALRDRLRWLNEIALAVVNLKKLDDCLYDLARAAARPLSLYYVLLRWLLREQDDPNLGRTWERLRNPLTQLLNSLMSDEHKRVTSHLRRAAQIAYDANLRGSSYRHTSKAEPFTAFIQALKSRRDPLDIEAVFAALIQLRFARLQRIRDHEIGDTTYQKIRSFYEALRGLLEDAYSGRVDRLLADRKMLEAAYLWFLEEPRLAKKYSQDSDALKHENPDAAAS
jgi:CRISPR-associated protein Csc3